MIESVLLTGLRMPSALTFARAFDEAGVTVYGAGSFDKAPAWHSRHLAAHTLTRPAADDPAGYADDVAAAAEQYDVDLVLPAFEEIFYLTAFPEKQTRPLFASSFDTLHRLHDKSRFVALCDELGLRTPQTITVTDKAGLREAVSQFELYVARPAYSRGGAIYLTNHGERAGEIDIDDCEPSQDNPFLVQEYIDGADHCSESVVRDGEVVAHCPYWPSLAGPGGYAIQFETLEDFGSLEIAQTICRHLGFTGNIGFDMRMTDDGPVMMECNPRTTSGTFMTPRPWLVEAIAGEPTGLHMVEPGQKRQYDAALLSRQLNQNPAAQTIHDLFTVKDPDFSLDDLVAGLHFFSTMYHWTKVAKEQQLNMVIATTLDIAWNGDPIPGATAEGADAA